MLGLGILLLILSVVSRVSSQPVTLNPNDENGEFFKEQFQPVAINPVDNTVQSGVNNGALLSGHLFKTVKRYYCSLTRNEDHSNTLLYGTNGWSFPRQDVNLTLSYPTASQAIPDIEDYTIIGYQLILFTDGSDSSGFITSGGLLQQHITLNFLFSQITILSYEFWLYGVPQGEATTPMPSYINYLLC